MARRVVVIGGGVGGLVAALELACAGQDVTLGSVKNLGRYAASRMACWPKRPSSTAALT